MRQPRENTDRMMVLRGRQGKNRPKKFGPTNNNMIITARATLFFLFYHRTTYRAIELYGVCGLPALVEPPPEQPTYRRLHLARSVLFVERTSGVRNVAFFFCLALEAKTTTQHKCGHYTHTGDWAIGSERLMRF